MAESILTENSTVDTRFPKVTGTTYGTTQHALHVAVLSSGGIPVHDYIAVTYPSSTQEVYTFKSGGSGGTTVATITVNYTDASKASLLNVART